MASYLFGQDFTYNLYPYKDRQKIKAVPAQTITAYLFDYAPTKAQGAAGTNALQTVTQELTVPGAISLEFEAIDDPNAERTSVYDRYYIAVNFVLSASEQTQTVVRAIDVFRVFGQDEEIGMSFEDVQGLFPDVLYYLSKSQVEDMIVLAEAEIRNKLKNDGLSWASVNKPSELHRVALFRTLYYVYNSQRNDFEDQREEMKRSYYDELNLLVLSYDDTKTGVTTSERDISGSVFLRR